MLSHLNIKNYALIEDIDISLNRGLTILTGETGAGKSIILGAIGLLAGNRADRSMIKNSDKKCVIEATFDIGHLGLKDLFEEHDMDYADQTIIRREFNKEGKSRVFINDSPAVLLHLREIMNRLLDVHSQHENLNLNKRAFQLEAVDLYARNTDLLKEYTRSYKDYREAEERLERMKAESEKLRENTDLLSHQLNELSDADLSEGEQEELESELDTLNHSEEILSNFKSLDQLFGENEANPVSVLSEAQQLIRKTRSHFSEMQEISERMDSLLIELEDIRRELERLSEHVSYDPERLQLVQDRISLIFGLQQKFRVNTVAELIEKKEALREELSDIESLDDRLEQAQKEFQKKKQHAEDLAEKISTRRKAVLTEMEEKIIAGIHNLGMVNSRFKIDKKEKEMGLDGKDEVDFLFNANKGLDLQPIGKVASGGELSRLMLSIKAVLTGKTELPTIIFDEIDTGISGPVADKMGRIIREMSKTTQVLAITHLPQIAAQGDQHLEVFKDDSGGASKTGIHNLEGEKRTEEIARLLSGENVSKEAMENAKVLLNSRS